MTDETSQQMPEQSDPPRLMLPPQSPSAFCFLFFGEDGLRSGWGLLLFFCICEVLWELLAALIIHSPPAALAGQVPAPQRAVDLISAEGIGCLAIAMATRLMAAIERRPVGIYGFGGARKFRHFLAGCACGFLLLFLLIACMWTTGLIVFERQLLFGRQIFGWGALWLVGFLLVALLEESLLRGYAQYTLARGFAGLFAFASLGNEARNRTATGFWVAAILLSICFGAVHASNPGETPVGLASAGLIGLIFCLSLWRTGSLWWALGFHAVWDWAQSFLFGVADSGTTIKGHLLATHPAGNGLLSGGSTGPEGSLFVLPILALAALVVFWTLKPQTHLPAP